MAPSDKGTGDSSVLQYLTNHLSPCHVSVPLSCEDERAVVSNEIATRAPHRAQTLGLQWRAQKRPPRPRIGTRRRGLRRHAMARMQHTVGTHAQTARLACGYALFLAFYYGMRPMGLVVFGHVLAAVCLHTVSDALVDCGRLRRGACVGRQALGRGGASLSPGSPMGLAGLALFALAQAVMPNQPVLACLAATLLGVGAASLKVWSTSPCAATAWSTIPRTAIWATA